MSFVRHPLTNALFHPYTEKTSFCIPLRPSAMNKATVEKRYPKLKSARFTRFSVAIYSLRRGPLIDTVFENDGDDPQAVTVDLDDPMSILIARETQNRIENHPLAKNLEIAFDQLEEVEEMDSSEIGEAFKVKRRQSFEIKSRQVERARDGEIHPVPDTARSRSGF